MFVNLHSGRFALLRQSGNTYAFDSYLLDDPAYGAAEGIAISSDKMYLAGGSFTGHMTIFKRNKTDKYNVHQTISDFEHGVHGCDMSNDHQYIAYHNFT